MAFDVGLASKQFWVNISCLLECHWTINAGDDIFYIQLMY